MHLVTGYAGKEHVTAADMGALYAGIATDEKVVLPVNEQFAATVISSNLIEIASGDALLNGRHVRIPYGQTDRCAVDSCGQGFYRTDLIVIRYTKDEDTFVEKAELVVLKGPSAESAGQVPPAPAMVIENILDEPTLCEYALYKLRINGTGIAAVEPMFKVLDSIQQIKYELQGKLDCAKILWSGYLQGDTVSGNSETFSIPANCFFDGGKQLILAINGYCPEEETFAYGLCQVGLCFGDATDFGTDDSHMPYKYGEGEMSVYVKENEASGHTISGKIQVVKVADDRYAMCKIKNSSSTFCMTSICAIVPV